MKIKKSTLVLVFAISVFSACGPGTQTQDPSGTGPSLEIIYPNGGEVFFSSQNTNCSILWDSYQAGPFINLDLYLNGVKLRSIVSNQTNTGNYTWQIPADLTAGLRYQIGVSETDGVLSDLSDMQFCIIASNQSDMGTNASIIFLHHSTGGVIWGGGVSTWMANYNTSSSRNYSIIDRAYPSGDPYPWDNYPYDYWNIWINHAGSSPYLEEDTLEILTASYDVIIWKHCYPVANVGPDDIPDVTNSQRTMTNYCLQYNALKQKMHDFPWVRFIVWTGAANVEANSTQAEAERAQAFCNWVINVWDEPGDNIYIWDFRELETEGGLYLLNSYAASPTDSHPGSAFAATVAPYFGQRIVNVIEGLGDSSSLTGQ